MAPFPSVTAGIAALDGEVEVHHEALVGVAIGDRVVVEGEVAVLLVLEEPLQRAVLPRLRRHAPFVRLYPQRPRLLRLPAPQRRLPARRQLRETRPRDSGGNLLRPAPR